MIQLARILGIATGVVGLVNYASAVPSLYLSDGTVSLTVVDGSAFDSDPRAGVVTYNGALGANWTMCVSTGDSKPEVGSPTDPQLQFSSSSTSKGAGALTIEFSDDGFGPVSGTLVNTLQGEADGSVSGETFVDSGNTAFAHTMTLASGLISGATQLANLSMAGPFSITEVITIIHPGKGLTTVSQELSVPDAGLTLAMLGTGLIGLAAFARFRKKS